MIRGSLRWSNDPDRPHLFVGVAGSGHCVNFDQAAGGTAPTPVETLALALAACSAFDVITILRKKRQQVTGYEVRVEAEQRVGPPAVFTGVRLRHLVRGHAVDPHAVQQAVELSRDKYCSISAMLAPSMPIEYTAEVLEDEVVRGAEPDVTSATSAAAS